MSEQVAWVVFATGLVSLACSQAVLWTTGKASLPLMIVSCLTVALLVAIKLDANQVKPFTDVFTGAGIVLAAAKFVSDRQKDEEAKADGEHAKLKAEKERRNELLVSQWRLFVGEERYVRAVYMLEKGDAQLACLGDVLPYEEYLGWKRPLDQLLEFLLQLVYSVRSNNLERDAVEEAVGWYYRRILELEAVGRYCQRHGYKSIVAFAVELYPEKRPGWLREDEASPVIGADDRSLVASCSADSSKTGN